MADESLDILIRTTADTAGARDAEASLRRVGDATKGNTEEAEKHNVKLRDQMFLLRQLGPEVTHFGHAAHIALEGGVLLPATAAALALGALTRETEKSDEAFKKVAEDARGSWGDVSGVIAKVAESLNELFVKHNEWRRHLAEDSGEVIKNLDAEIKKIGEMAAAARELAAARAEASPDQAEAKIQRRIADDRIARGAGDSEIARTESARGQVEKELEAAKKTEAAIFDRQMRGTGAVSAEKLKIQADAAAEAVKKSKEKMDAASDEVARRAHPSFGQSLADNALDLLSLNGFFDLLRPAGTARRDDALRKAEADERKAIAEHSGLQSLANKTSVAASRKKADEDALAAAASEAEKKVTELTGALHELTRRADAAKSRIHLDQDTRAQAAAMRGDPEHDLFSRIVMHGADALARQSRLRPGQQMSPGDIGAERDLAHLLNSLNRNTLGAVDAIRSHAGNASLMAGDIEDLKREAERMRNRLKSSRLNTGE